MTIRLFNEALNQDELAKVQIENASRADALFTFKTSFTTVYTALETLADGGDSKARSYHCSISKFDFIIILVTTRSLRIGKFVGASTQKGL